MTHLFAYGTLMCEDIMREVSGNRIVPAPATLRNCRRLSVKGEAFPGLVPFEGGLVTGVVYRYVPDSAWECLDRFEGEMYARMRVHVELSSGKALAVETYVVRPEFADRLESSEWNFEKFLRTGKRRFQQSYRGYKAL